MCSDFYEKYVESKIQKKKKNQLKLPPPPNHNKI